MENELVCPDGKQPKAMWQHFEKSVSTGVSEFSFQNPFFAQVRIWSFLLTVWQRRKFLTCFTISAACGIHEGKAPILDVPNLLGLERGGHISQELPRQD